MQLYKGKVGMVGKDDLSRRTCADPGIFVRGGGVNAQLTDKISDINLFYSFTEGIQLFN